MVEIAVDRVSLNPARLRKNVINFGYLLNNLFTTKIQRASHKCVVVLRWTTNVHTEVSEKCLTNIRMSYIPRFASDTLCIDTRYRLP